VCAYIYIGPLRLAEIAFSISASGARGISKQFAKYVQFFSAITEITLYKIRVERGTNATKGEIGYYDAIRELLPRNATLYH